MIGRMLFLDDTRKPPRGWDCVRDYSAFVAYIESNGLPDIISFDHDLAFEHYPLGEQNPKLAIPYDSYDEKTGYDCAKYLEERGLFPRQVIVHTMNPVGAMNIAAVFREHSRVLLCPYHNLEEYLRSKGWML